MDRHIRHFSLAASIAVILLPAVAIAQQPPTAKQQIAPQTERHDDPRACAHERATVGQSGVDVQKQPGQTLSDKLAKSGGVICPPSGVDSEIKAPTPQGGTMHVIPPPGSPGGDPNVQPK